MRYVPDGEIGVQPTPTDRSCASWPSTPGSHRETSCTRATCTGSWSRTASRWRAGGGLRGRPRVGVARGSPVCSWPATGSAHVGSWPMRARRVANQQPSRRSHTARSGRSPVSDASAASAGAMFSVNSGPPEPSDLFSAERPRLIGLSYRLLGFDHRCRGRRAGGMGALEPSRPRRHREPRCMADHGRQPTRHRPVASSQARPGRLRRTMVAGTSRVVRRPACSRSRAERFA